MNASRVADFYGLAGDHQIQTADAEQAYAQAGMEGPPTWMQLPREYQPAWWTDKHPNMVDPV